MPELPEVETIVTGLKPNLEGKLIHDVQVFNKRTITNPKDIEDFIATIKRTTINEVTRKGKYIDIILDNKMHLIIHLRMTGQLIYSNKEMDFTHLRAMFKLDNGLLYFNDIRKFGTISLLHQDELLLEKGYHTLGVEPLSNEFSDCYLKEKIKGTRPVKNFILDQTVIAGLGNIYADECLFLANINPKRPVNTLDDMEITLLVDAIKEVLSKAIENRGTTFSDYKDSYGGKGENQNFLKVYGRGKEDCLKCGKKLFSDKIGGRTTVFCLDCQK